MKLFVFAGILALSAASGVVDDEIVAAFAKFQKDWGKSYSGSEYGARLAIFADNVAHANAENYEHILMGGTPVHGITKFMDLTPAEFTAMYKGYIPSNKTDVERVTPEAPAAPLDSVNWMDKGAVTPVKDQGQCGSCWAFSATEAIESYAKLSGKYSLEKLSPQQINSCDRGDGGCNGGNTETAYEYVKKAGGIESGADYPYTSGGGRTGTCKFDASKVKVKITGYKSVSRGEKNLQNALASGPVSICVAADAFQTYRSGILKRCPGQIDHCVQAIGYNTADNYWLVRNSWGTSWGERGLIRIEMGSDLCHISDDVTYPTF